jgi:UDP-N-acetylglucosamine enolpyruvyl transferase
MDKFLIKGGKALRGRVTVSGAKNSALPVMAAALLTAEKVTLHNIPKVRDWGPAGGFAFEGAGADGGGNCHVARVH